MPSTFQAEAGTSAVLDRTGVIASVGCAIHCMIAPILVLLAPTFGGWWVHPGTHLLIAALVLPIAASALWRGFRSHRQAWVLLTGALGMALVILGVLLPWLAPTSGSAAHATGVCQDCCPTLLRSIETGEISLRIPPASIVTVFGGLALIVAHLANLRCACARCVRLRPLPPA